MGQGRPNWVQKLGVVRVVGGRTRGRGIGWPAIGDRRGRAIKALISKGVAPLTLGAPAFNSAAKSRDGRTTDDPILYFVYEMAFVTQFTDYRRQNSSSKTKIRIIEPDWGIGGANWPILPQERDSIVQIGVFAARGQQTGFER
jgi:hypothetical protein